MFNKPSCTPTVIKQKPEQINQSLLADCDPLTVAEKGEIPDAVIIRMAGEYKQCADLKRALSDQVRKIQDAD